MENATAADAGAALEGTGASVPPTVRSRTTHATARVEGLEVTVFEIPTDQPESDGTLEWDSTTIIVVEAFNGSERGLGYTYGDRAVATLIESKLAEVVRAVCPRCQNQTWRLK